MADMHKVSIWRGGSGVKFENYSVPARQSQTVLDIVTWVQRNIDPTLTYRFACRVGMCGSCAMTVNGAPRWTCRTHASKVINGGNLKIAPLRNLPVIKDLACDMTEFFEKWQKAEARFHPTKTRHDELEQILPSDPARVEANEGIECINCAVCYSSCDTVAWNKAYLGPAALNRAWTLTNDVRDGGQSTRLKALAQEGGCHSCHSHQSCQAYCPNQLNPTASIAGLKKHTMAAYLKGELK